MGATAEQIKAVKARGKVLVSASAGAGKTTVMIKRLADILEEGASLDSVLAVTFTKKAAAQMKDKLRRELIERLNCGDEKKRENIRAQLGKVNTADISTIHSFCARLIRTYFYVLKVDASFEVLSDGAEANALKARAMDDLFDGMYAANDPDLLLLLSKLRKRRSDGAVRGMLAEAYEEVRQRPDYIALLDNACELTYTEDGFARACAEYGEVLAQKFGVLLSAIEKFALSFKPAVNAAGYLKVLGEMRQTLLSLIESKSVFGLPSRLSASVKPKVKAEVAEDDAAFVAFTDGIKKRYKSLIKDAEEAEAERHKFFASGELAKAFTRVLKRFDEAYSGVKREEGKLDYGDLEHFALQLLKSGDGDVRETVREKYSYVFVDEYQDVNPIQDEIITAVAGGDVFCVGDLKQAIYGFRGSRSKFFAEKSVSVRDGGEYVVLPDNFRSSGAVISFVNMLFSTVMKPPLCEFDYAQGHEMRGGARYADGGAGKAEICVFDCEEEQSEDTLSVYSVAEAAIGERGFTAEGSAVLQLVEEALKSEYYDPDEGRFKKVEAGDICVLTRKRANRNALGIVRALTSRYPVAGAAEVNVCDRPEIKRLLDVLSYLDNGKQDIPLVTSLLSPVGGLTENELVKIRIYGDSHRAEGEKRQPFGLCCEMYANGVGDGLSQKLKSFFARVERLRTTAGSIGASRLIDEIMRVGGFSSAFDTEQKLTALRRLQREAYSPNGELYLGAFLARIKAGEYNISAPARLSSDCVKVMTMHASKGLEFPVVIVADIAASFAGDERCEMPFDDDFGFAPRYFGEDRTYGTTLLRKLYKARKEREELSNEINLFYVACTRAKYALYVLCGGAEKYDEVKANFADNYAALFDLNAFTPRILAVQPQKGGNCGEVKRVLDDSRADEKMLEKLRDISAFGYGFELGKELPVKSSASRLIALQGGEQNAEILFDDEMESGAGTSVDSGIAYHRFLELCDFTVKDKEGIERQIETWVSAGLMTEEQRALLKTEELVSILSMPVFADVAGQSLYREREFLCRLPSADYLSLKEGGKGFSVGEDDGNGVIVQGAIDLLQVNRVDGKAVSARIVDYKYSAHSDAYVQKKYAPQLALYKSVVAKIYSLPESAVDTVIINIRACRMIPMLTD